MRYDLSIQACSVEVCSVSALDGSGATQLTSELGYAFDVANGYTTTQTAP